MAQVDYTNIEQFTPEQLEGIITEYPWFSYAREVLLLKLAAISREIFDTELRHSAVFLPSRRRLYDKVMQIVPADEKPKEEPVETQPVKAQPVEVIDIEQEEKVEDVKAAAAEAIAEAKKERAGSPVVTKIKYIPVGGDYFSREDFEQLEREDGSLPSEAAHLATGSSAGDSNVSSVIGPDGKVNFEDPEFYTETLGQVYAQQGYYEQAIEVFSKLILLYPQKSAYFAALVKETERAKKEAASGKGK
jgi:tetratricopeptide (TPR) repeat protein